MEQLNFLEVETLKGYKSISVYHGDILSFEEPVDILFVSIFRGGLVPRPGTLLGSLYNAGIDAKRLFKNKAYDFRKGLNTWLSQPITGHPFKRILFFEMRSLKDGILANESIEVIFENLFLSLMVLSRKKIPVKNVVLPVLGTGNQRLNEAKVIPLLLTLAEKFLNELDNLQSMTFIEKDSSKAITLSEGINKALGRLEIRLESVTFGNSIRNGISGKIIRIRKKVLPQNGLFNELKKAIEDNNSRYYQIGILGRRVLELILHDIIPETRQSLNDMIRMTRLIGVPGWIISYMHLIRAFGNISAHYNSESETLNSSFNEEDLMINLLAIDKILEFWIENREELKRSAKSAHIPENLLTSF